MEKTSYFIILILLILNSCTGDYYTDFRYHPPVPTEDGIITGTMPQVSMDTLMMAEMLGRIYANKYDQVHSILIYKNGLLVFEEYMEGNKYAFDGQYYYGDRIKWHRDSMHYIMSCAKSVTSAIMGIAADKGYFDVGESIFRYLPDHQQFKKDGRENITIEHLLTMTSGLDWDEWSGAHSPESNDIDRIYFACQADPVACIIGRNQKHTPGTHFTYSGGNMIILGEILRNATGMNILDFGNKYLFGPLGIDSVFWYHFDNGAYACDGAMKMKPRDMLKIGILFVDNGVWNGQRILSKEWVAKSQTRYNNNTRINVPLDDAGRSDYGYTWWINEASWGGNKARLFQASGWGGQEIIVLPELEMVVVFTGGNYAVKKHIYKILEGYILPSITV